LTHDAYDEIGGVEQSLATYAENFYTKHENEQQQARRIFIQLVYPGKGTEDTRRIATRVQLGKEGWVRLQTLLELLMRAAFRA
jgi:truncated hemoglobin YjbI